MTHGNVRAAIKVECDRQHVGEDRQEMLFKAYLDLYNFNRQFKLTETYLSDLARTIEPSNRGQYRTTPVTFPDTTSAIPAQSVPRAMENWMEWFNTVRGCSKNDAAVEVAIKEFLDIHPFTDGNGRTGWLLRVWMLNQWNDPQPLPDYYSSVSKYGKVDSETDDITYLGGTLISGVDF